MNPNLTFPISNFGKCLLSYYNELFDTLPTNWKLIQINIIRYLFPKVPFLYNNEGLAAETGIAIKICCVISTLFTPLIMMNHYYMDEK